MIQSLETPQGQILIREAAPADAMQYRDLRLGALQDSPVAFSADYEANLAQPAKYWEERLIMQPDQATLFLAAHEGDLIGMTGILRGSSPKTRHDAMIWGVYVKPAWRGLHIAAEMIHCCAEWARVRDIVVMKLGVMTVNQPAIRCYERCGFKTYGTEPCVIFYEGKYYDEYLMYRPVDDR